jgi:hypothetical protein
VVLIGVIQWSEGPLFKKLTRAFRTWSPTTFLGKNPKRGSFAAAPLLQLDAETGAEPLWLGGKCAR